VTVVLSLRNAANEKRSLRPVGRVVVLLQPGDAAGLQASV
jgi:hypothetical protein